MSEGILIDNKGRAWPEHSWHLARRLGRTHLAQDLNSYAVREHGYIHVRFQEGGARVGMCAGRFTQATLAAVLFLLKERRPERIILAILSGGEWAYEMLASVWEFAERAEQLAVGGAIEVRYPWLAAERDLRSLSLPSFARIRPIMRIWEANRGRMPDDIEKTVSGLGLLGRMVLTRRRPGSSRMTFALFGAGIEFMRPCESLLMVDRDIDDLPDREYGARTTRAYSECLAGRRARLESVRAMIRESKTTAIQTCYDRILLPWNGRGDDLFVMGMSLTRVLNRRPIELKRQVC